MARVREFNENIALDKAIELFWEKGYAHTSMREVVKHTGVAHAGLYTAFGGKDDLFKAAIEKYEQRIFTYLFGGLEASRASLKDIKKLFHFITSAKDDKYFKHGCFIANSALEFGNTDHPINEVLTRTFNRQVKAFDNALTNALERKEISADTNIAETAASFAVLFYGCSSLTRMNAPNEAIQQAIAAGLNSIKV
jgi:TetR/AcrR family transcriptional repressor of nem operon